MLTSTTAKSAAKIHAYAKLAPTDSGLSQLKTSASMLPVVINSVMYVAHKDLQSATSAKSATY